MGNFFAALTFIFFSSLAWANVNKEGDVQIWERNFVIKRIDDRCSLWTISEFRLGDDASKFYYAHLQAMLYYKMFSWLTIGPGYSQIWTREATVSWKPLSLPLVDMILKARFAGWEIHDRNRLQYLINDSDPSHWLYRNRFRIIAPSMFDSPRLSVFTDNEFFWLQRQGIYEDRLSGGFMVQWDDYWGGEIFYMARFLEQAAGWTYMTVFTGTLLFSF